MGKHRKTEDLNTKPLDSNATPEQKAREFDEQWGQNHHLNPSHTPALDAYEAKRDGKK